ncbi:MAG: acyl-CoA dehydrogenase family protein [Deltaproteobacteria bacterium]|nr:acyl-CoA dehydrogenase family protein [Deltaproteobacteria bacterium]
MAFIQDPPRLSNQYDDDPLLADHLARIAPEMAQAIASELRELGELAAGELYAQSLAERELEPVLTQWDPWGNRIDHIEVTPLWKRAAVIAAERGLVAAGYEPRWGEHARTHQFAMVHLLSPSLDFYSCPLAMTDGAARTLLDSEDPVVAPYVARLTSRDPARMWTSGQWMTERTGGSDVSQTETVARQADDGTWKLFGTKWFTSATTAEMALTLARPVGNAAGSRGLALFLVETRDAAGKLCGIEVNRLKDKLGTRKVPTAELTLAGAPAIQVGTGADGVKAITPMLTITRTWNSVGAVSAMRRGLAIARDYSKRRKAFGQLLADKPLHTDTLATLEAEYAGAFLLAFRLVELVGRRDHGSGTDQEERLLRALTPIAKLTTAKQAVAVVQETGECLGGAGYVEDTGVPRILADAHVLPIWEGTTNVLSLDTLRALGKGGAVEALAAEVEAHCRRATDPQLARPVAVARAARDHALAWAAAAMSEPAELEAGARRLALTFGRALELAYLCAHAQWCLDHDRGPRAAAAARRFACSAVDLIDDRAIGDTQLLTR